MDRTTEFGSDEFFRKQRALEQAAAAHNASSSTTGEPSVARPTFNLPLGQSRPPIGKRRASNDATKPSDQKLRSVGHDLSSTRNHRRPSFTKPLAGIRSKVPTLHKPFAGQLNDISLAEEPAKRRQSLWDLFDSLPIELQVQVICPLPIRTILDLRRVSKSFHKLVSLQEGPIVRHHIKRSIPSYALRLYPLPDNSELNLRYFCGLWHRLHVAFRLTTLLAEHVAKNIFLRDNRQKREEFQPQYERMHRRLVPLIFTIFHFFETYRLLHLEHLKSGGTPLSRQAYTINPMEKQVLSKYSDETLLKVHEVYLMIISSFFFYLRVPSYIGKLELVAKGLNGEALPIEVYHAILTAGGLGQAKRFWQIKSYNDRRHSVETWYSLLSSTPSHKSSTAMSKISRLSPFHRKRSTAEVATMENSAGHEAASCKDWFCVNPACVESFSSRRRQPGNEDSIYYSSLSAGPPMAPIPRDDWLLLLSDALPLPSIWSPTAEAEILERGIVDNINKIKKNNAVLLALIGPIRVEEHSPDGLYEDWVPPGESHGGVSGGSVELMHHWDS